jgi:hypothetical protein
MGTHEYTSQVAFELLMRKLSALDSELAAHITSVVDQGKDVQESEPSGRGRKKNYRIYRKTVPYTYDEALSVALNALTAYFIEQPLFAQSCLDNMAPSPVAALKGFRYFQSSEKTRSAEIVQGSEMTEKQVQIELWTETQLPTKLQVLRPDHDTQEVKRVPMAQLEEQRANILRLRTLLNFADN